MTDTRAWYCCARINRTDKGYFSYQIDGFEELNPLVVTWDDGRPVAEQGDSVVLKGGWNKSLSIRGGHRLKRAWLRAKALFQDNPFAASGREKEVLMQIAIRKPPSLIYCHTGFVALRMMPVVRALDVPLIVHSHGLDINLPDPLHQRIYQQHLPLMTRVVVVARWMIPWFVENGYDADKIIVSPMGVPLMQTSLNIGQRDTPLYFVFIGRFVRYKGIDRTIRSFAMVHKNHPEAQLRIVGNGPLEEELRALVANLGLQEAVAFTGALSASETLRTIAGSCALVHHALDKPDGPEAFPTVISEAMALGKPVIGTKCGGIPDQVVDGQTGYLVAQEDIVGMAHYMEKILKDAGLGEKLGRAGRQHAEERLDSARLAREMEARLMAL